MTSRPCTTMLPVLSSRRLAPGSNISWPPGMTATPATRASTSRKTGRVTTAVSAGPGTPRDQELLSLQRLQPSGRPRDGAGAVERAGRHRRLGQRSWWSAAPWATDASSQGRPSQPTPPPRSRRLRSTPAPTRSLAPGQLQLAASLAQRCSTSIDASTWMGPTRIDRPRADVQVGPGHVEVGRRVPGQQVPTGHVQDLDPEVEAAARQRQAGSSAAPRSPRRPAPAPGGPGRTGSPGPR